MAFNTRIQIKRDSATNWENNDPVLLEGELVIVTTNAGATRFKIGDGTKKYTQLPFQDESLYSVLSSKATEGYVDAAIEAAVAILQEDIDSKASATHASQHASGGSDPIRPADIGAQAVLTFDVTPTANSTNPVTSNGIKNYVDSSFVYAAEDDITALFA